MIRASSSRSIPPPSSTTRWTGVRGRPPRRRSCARTATGTISLHAITGPRSWAPATRAASRQCRSRYKPATSGMLTSLHLSSNRNSVKGANVRLLICADLNGKPDLTNTYADVSVVSGASVSSDDGFRDGFVMPAPVLLKGGRTYHFVFTCGQRQLRFVPAVVEQGNSSPFLAYANGDWAVAAAGARISMLLEFATFANPTITIPLAPLQIAGGGDTVDFQCVAGPARRLHHRLPDLHRRQVGVARTGAQQHLSAGRQPVERAVPTSCSPVRRRWRRSSTRRPRRRAFRSRQPRWSMCPRIQTPPAPVTTVHKSVVVDNWNAAVHTLTAGLRTGPAFATPASRRRPSRTSSRPTARCCAPGRGRSGAPCRPSRWSSTAPPPTRRSSSSGAARTGTPRPDA